MPANYCTRCESFYTTPKSCNCYEPTQPATLAPLPLQPWQQPLQPFVPYVPTITPYVPNGHGGILWKVTSTPLPEGTAWSYTYTLTNRCQ